MDFAVLADHSMIIEESEKKDKYLYFAWELKKVMEYKGDGDANCNWCTWKGLQRLGKETGWYRNQKTSRDHPDYRIDKISQNTEMSPEDLRRLAVTQTSVKDHQLTMVWKTRIILILGLEYFELRERIRTISQNTAKSPGDLRRLAVTQTPVKDHQLTMVCRTLERVKYKSRL